MPRLEGADIFLHQLDCRSAGAILGLARDGGRRLGLRRRSAKGLVPSQRIVPSLGAGDDAGFGRDDGGTGLVILLTILSDALSDVDVDVRRDRRRTEPRCYALVDEPSFARLLLSAGAVSIAGDGPWRRRSVAALLVISNLSVCPLADPTSHVGDSTSPRGVFAVGVERSATRFESSRRGVSSSRPRVRLIARPSLALAAKERRPDVVEVGTSVGAFAKDWHLRSCITNRRFARGLTIIPSLERKRRDLHGAISRRCGSRPGGPSLVCVHALKSKIQEADPLLAALRPPQCLAASLAMLVSV